MTKPISTRAGKPEIKSHTALRGLGALAVMVNHFFYIDSATGQSLAVSDYYQNYGMVLEFFFLMSGFILSYIYFDGFSMEVKGKEVAKFLWARLARMYPVYFFAVIALIAMAVIKTQLPGLTASPPVPVFHIGQNHDYNTVFTLITNLLLMQAWGFVESLSWNYPAWALSAEWAAYILFPCMCLLVGKLPRTGPLILVAGAVAAYAVLEEIFGNLNVPGYYGAYRCIPGFAIGVAVYHITRAVRAPSLPLLNLMQMLSLIALFLAFFFAGNQILIVAAIAAFLFVTSENRGWLSDLLDWGPLQYLGKISFTIYMMHLAASKLMSPFLHAASTRLDLESEPWWLVARGIILMIFAIPISAVAFRYVEMPARDYLTNWMKRRSARARPVAADLVPAVASAPIETPRG